MKSRRLTVSYLPGNTENCRCVPLPFIRLKGKWMIEAGFAPGDSIQVDVEYCRLVISKLTPDGTVVEAGINPNEFAFVKELNLTQRKQ